VNIHPTAIVDPGAELAEGVRIGPYCVIGKNVRIGAETELVSHVVVEGDTIIGCENRIFSFAAIGFPPQDLKFRGEPTQAVIGDRNTLREYVSINRGTVGGGGVTTLGNDNFVMAYAHVAHDCHIGDRVIFANAGTLAGHVEVQDDATVGAFTAVHQFCRIGKYGFTGGFTAVSKDVLPFSKTAGARAKAYGANVIGLQRKGFSEETVDAIKRALKLLLHSKLNTTQALQRIREEVSGVSEVDYLVKFVEESERGVIK